MINIDEVQEILKKDLNFSDIDLQKLTIFNDEILKFNKKYNLIGKSTEKELWHRHFLDCAQLVNFIDFSKDNSLADLGTGAGLPGIVLAIFNKNPNFHVKLYEKSIIKCNFLRKTIKKLNIKCNLYENDYRSHIINTNYIVCRAFKKLEESIRISREIAKKPHKLIILKGKSAQDEIKKASKQMIYKYRLIDSMTDKKSKILIIDVK